VEGGRKKLCDFFFKKKKKKKKKKKRLTTQIVHTIHPHTYTLTHAHKNLDYFFVHLSKKICFSVYTGGWRLGVKHGRGKLTYAHGGGEYTGEFRLNLRDGAGRMVYPSGNVYDGAWADGERHGHGTMQWLDRGEVYEGHFSHGQPEGHGTHTWSTTDLDATRLPILNRYVGEHVAGMRHGQGSFFYSTGAVYTGAWASGRKHGEGRMVDPAGRCVAGLFDMDRTPGETDLEPGEAANEAEERMRHPGQLGAEIEIGDIVAYVVGSSFFCIIVCFGGWLVWCLLFLLFFVFFCFSLILIPEL
jgi:hypothetical protein